MEIARALLGPSRDRDAIRRSAAAAGLRVDLPEEPATEVWPEHWTVTGVAVRMSSQLHVGPSGPIGYRYEALPVVLDALSVPAGDRLQLLDDLRVIEGELVRRIHDGARRG